MNKKGFTLIELLMVIAAIALLLSIITPAGKSEMYAQVVVCKSNLRQYHIASELYATEQDERYPDPWRSLYKELQFVCETQRYCRWHKAVNFRIFVNVLRIWG